MALSPEVLVRIRTVLEENVDYADTEYIASVADALGASLLARTLLHVLDEVDTTGLDSFYDEAHPIFSLVGLILEGYVKDDDDDAVLDALNWDGDEESDDGWFLDDEDDDVDDDDGEYAEEED